MAAADTSRLVVGASIHPERTSLRSGSTGKASGTHARPQLLHRRQTRRECHPAEYEDRSSGNANWERGDWNGDGNFDSADLVKAFQTDHFERHVDYCQLFMGEYFDWARSVGADARLEISVSIPFSDLDVAGYLRAHPEVRMSLDYEPGGWIFAGGTAFWDAPQFVGSLTLYWPEDPGELFGRAFGQITVELSENSPLSSDATTDRRSARRD